MGVGRWLLIGDTGSHKDVQAQQADLDDLRQKLEQSRQPTQDLARRVTQLERENDQLRLYLAALVRYLLEQNIVQKDEFKKLIETIDAEDGRQDGRFSGDAPMFAKPRPE